VLRGALPQKFDELPNGGLFLGRQTIDNGGQILRWHKSHFKYSF